MDAPIAAPGIPTKGMSTTSAATLMARPARTAIVYVAGAPEPTRYGPRTATTLYATIPGSISCSAVPAGTNSAPYRAPTTAGAASATGMASRAVPASVRRVMAAAVPGADPGADTARLKSTTPNAVGTY